MSSRLYAKAAKAAYKRQNKNKKLSGHRLDPELSGRRVTVWSNPVANEVIISHRGTDLKRSAASDLLTDISLPFTHNNKRFKHAQKIQNQAEAKYAGSKTITVGHSLGGAIAREVGANSSEIHTFNAPSIGVTRKKTAKDTKIFTNVNGLDPISLGSSLRKPEKNETMNKRTRIRDVLNPKRLFTAKWHNVKNHKLSR